MVHDRTPRGGAERWWVLGRADIRSRVFLVAVAWLFIIIFIGPLLGEKAGVLACTAAAVISCYLFGRAVIVAISVQDGFILLRRLLPGWGERVPVSRLAYGLHLRELVPIGGVLQESVILLGWPMMPAIIDGTFRTAPDGTPRDAKPDWAALVDCLRNLLEPKGRWKVLRWPFRGDLE
jgi:hypothetical protein